jgi:hypothetical protein
MRGEEEQTLAFFDTGILALYSSLLGLDLALWVRCVAFVGKGGGGGEAEILQEGQAVRFLGWDLRQGVGVS